ncbi:MAG: hypothetical protein IKP64_12245 [Selenomonadaceae bacterium]|nr:hypothetical protein [Selenomonadaceae bacterium]
MAEENCERYCSIEESIIQACKEVNLMRKGLLPEQGDWRDWLDDLREKYKDDLNDEPIH